MNNNVSIFGSVRCYMISEDREKTIIDKYSWVFSFILSAVAMYLLILCSGMAGNGEYLVIRADGFEQFMGDIQMVIRSILNGENPLYQFCLSMGFSAVLPIALEVINPFNILYFIFHQADFNTVTILILVLKSGVIGSSFHLFARKICNTDTIWAIVFSAFYSMSAFPIVYGMIYFFWLDVLYVIPICAIAVHLSLFEKKISLLTIVFSYIFITQFYMGYLTGIFGLLYFMLLLIANYKRFEKKEVFHALFRFFLSTVNAILISAIVWIPVALFLIKYNPSDRTEFTNPQIGLMEVLNNLFWGESQTTEWAPYIYCGIPCFLLLLMFFLNKRIQIQDKIIYGLLLLFYIAGCFVTPLYRLLHGFDAPDSYNYRFSFLISFLVCAIACKQIVFLKDIQKRYLFGWVVFLVALYLLEGRFEKFEIGTFSSNTGPKLVINLIFILFWTAILIVYTKTEKKKNILNVILLILTFFEVVSNGYASVNAYGALQVGGKKKQEYYAWKREYEYVLDEINYSDNKSFYRLVAFGDYLHNSDSYLGYKGISDFCTGENEKLRHLMGDLGLYTSKAETYATGMTPSLEMILSVKDELYLNIDSPFPEKEGKPEIIENEYYLPIGYMVSRDSLEDLPLAQNVFENNNMLIRALSGIDGIYEPVSEDSIEFIEDGLYLSEDRTSLDSYSNEGHFLVVVRNEENPVFVQFEQEKREVYGIAFMPFENMVCNSDAYVSFPIAARLNDYDDATKYVEICSFDDFDGPFLIDGINVYRLNEDKLRESYNILNQNVLHVEEWKNGYVKGTIDVDDSTKVLLTSIPMIDGWTVLVDGVKADPLGAVNDVFMAVDFAEKGYHTVEFVYECPGLKAGIAVSLAGICFLGIIICVKRITVKEKIRK